MSFQKSKDISDKCLFQILLLVSIKKKKKLLIDIIHLFNYIPPIFNLFVFTRN